jgi:trans-2,3-dihydro-3-hydroxyanthranilate isomerase
LASRSPNASPAESLAEISLDLKVGKVPVTFRVDGLGKSFGEMRQVPPQFGSLHDKETVARLHNLTSDDIADFAPIQTVSTGLPYAIVPLKRLESLQTLRINEQNMNEYVANVRVGGYAVQTMEGEIIL